jgi:pimeloyl-ACP methyl ester carboxylesterase
MIADTVGVLDHLGVAKADFFGHSMGGMIATGMAIRHPERVRSLIALSVGYRLDGFLPEIVEMNRDPTHKPSPELVPLLPTGEHFAAWQASYARNAPDPAAFLTVLGKLNRMLVEWSGWTPEELKGIRAPTLLVVGDRDFVPPEHIAAMARLIPGADLAILPGTTHMSILERGDWLVSMTQARIATGIAR